MACHATAAHHETNLFKGTRHEHMPDALMGKAWQGMMAGGLHNAYNMGAFVGSHSSGCKHDRRMIQL